MAKRMRTNTALHAPLEVEIVAKKETPVEPTSKIRFLVDKTVADHNGVVTQSFEAGKVYELPESICQRWLRRNVAELVEVAEPPKVKATSTAATKVSTGAGKASDADSTKD